MATKPTQKDIFLLTQRPDLASKFDEVYGNGAAAEVLAKAGIETGQPQVAPAQIAPQVQQMQQAARPQQAQPQGSYTGAAIRGLTPPLMGAAMGAPFGPVGMLAGSLALPAGDALTALLNTATAGAERVTGGQYGRVTPPSQAIQNLLTSAGVPKAETTGQRALETGLGAMGSTASQIGGLQRLAQTAVSPVTRAITQQMAQRPLAQTAVAIPAGAGDARRKYNKAVADER